VDRCTEWAFDYDDLPVEEVSAALRSFAPEYRDRLVDTAVTQLRAHPFAGVWSALEYACHVRDVFEVQRQRVDQILTEDCPTLTPMGRDERVTRNHYNEQDPPVVAGELIDAANELADAYARLTAEEWERTAIYNYPTVQERSLVWIARNATHEACHHLMDIDRQLGEE